MINSKIIELALFFSSYSFVAFKFFMNVIIRIIKHFYTPSVSYFIDRQKTFSPNLETHLIITKINLFELISELFFKRIEIFSHINVCHL